MKKTLAVILALVMVLSFTACGTGGTQENTPPAGNETENTPPASTGDDGFKVGAILIGDENEGYTFAHMEGIIAAVEAVGLDPDTDLIFKFTIPEDERCYDAAVDLAEQGCKIIFANSFGHESYMMQAASEYPDIYFAHATGTSAKTAGLENFANYFDNIFESRYVSGIVAGMKLQELLDSGEATTPHIGYVGAYPYAEVVSGYTAFFLGVKSIVSDVTMDVIYTNSWFDPTAEAAAAQSLMSSGAVIIGQHADSTGAPSTVQAALDAGQAVYSVGYNIDMLAVAPTAALTSAQNNWVVMYKAILDVAVAGGTLDSDYCFGYADNAVMISDLGPSVAEGTAEAVEAAIAAIKAGTLNVFDTSTFTVGGETVTSAFATDTDGDWVNDADEAIFDGYYHESYFQSAPSFSLRIDGITERS